MIAMTARERTALMIIVLIYQQERRGATLAEVAIAMGVSTSRAHVLVGGLRDMGMVEPAKAHSRRGAVPTDAGALWNMGGISSESN